MAWHTIFTACLEIRGVVKSGVKLSNISMQYTPFETNISKYMICIYSSYIHIYIYLFRLNTLTLSSYDADAIYYHHFYHPVLYEKTTLPTSCGLGFRKGELILVAFAFAPGARRLTAIDVEMFTQVRMAAKKKTGL